MSNIPIFDPNRGFRLWIVSEIYDGTTTGGIYVPNVNDAVLDWDTGIYRVVHVDIESGISQIEKFNNPSYNPDITTDDILMGISPSRPSEAYRLYVNARTDPIVAAIDSRLHVYGSENAHVRLFMGTDISTSGEVISLYYGDDGHITDDKYPLELVSTTNETNKAIKTPTTGYLSKAPDDGELITAVVYGYSGIVTSINPLLSVQTQYVRPVHKESKYISSIELRSPFQVDGNPNRLEVPLHLTIESLNLRGIVNYSDGSKRELPIDGTKFDIAGLETFVISLAGQTIPLMLIYHLSREEASYSSTADDGGSISRRYQLTTTTPINAYSVKLFVVPYWNTTTNKWSLLYFIYNLDRNISQDVTDLVMTGVVDGEPFDPNAYGQVQRLTIAIDMDKVSSDYLAFRHVQTYEITLLTPIEGTRPNWTLRYNPGSGTIYGKTNIITGIINESDTTLDISSGEKQLDDWLELMYLSLYPLFDVDIDRRPPMPSHVDLIYGDDAVSVETGSFHQPVIFPSLPRNGSTMKLRWYLKSEAKELELAMSPVTLIYENI